MNQLPTIDFDTTEPYITGPGLTNRDVVLRAFAMLQQHCHAASYNRGWWMDPVTGLSLIPNESESAAFDMTEVEPVIRAWFPYVIATKIALIHSEVSEMLESHRTGEWDDKIPFPGITAEGADVVIRVLDLLGMMQTHPEFAGYAGPFESPSSPFSIGEALLAKNPFNSARFDHSLEARRHPNGKKY